VIAAWVLLAVALAPLQPRLQTLASDESETFFARGADSTTVDRLLDTRFPEGGNATAVIAFEAKKGSIADYAEQSAAQRAFWRSQNGKQGGDPAKLARALIAIAAMQPPPRRFIAGSDSIAIAEQRIADLQAQVAALRDLSTALAM